MINRIALSALICVVGIAPALAQDETFDVGIWNQGPYGGDPPAGLCFDLMEAIAERSGLVFNYVPMPALELIPAVAADTLDLECSALAAPGRRDPGVVFIGPILTNLQTMLVPEIDTTDYAGIADFEGKRIGTTLNPGRQTFLEEAGYEPVTFDNAPAAGAALAAGEIDAWLVNGAEAPRLATETPGLRIVQTFSSTLVNYGMIGIGDGQFELIGQIAQALEALKIDGTLDAIADRHSVPRAPF
ncbi:MAG: substrate-binding periplasmic protein [Bauldia sp.]